jgi:type I restriction enzyme S subunit
MNDDWTDTTIGEVASVNPTEPQLSSEAPFITMADVDEWRTWARSSTSKGSRGGIRARGGDTLFARITPCLENGKIAMVPAELGAVGGSTEFIVLRAGAGLMPEFLFLWAASTPTHSAAVGLMVGTTGRQRVSGRDLMTLPISLPPLRVQRRIVDLMAHLDKQIANLRTERDAAAALLAGVVAHHSQTVSGGERTVREACSAVIGGIWGKPAGEGEVDVLALGPRVYAPGTPHLRVDGSPTRSFSMKQVASRLVATGDIILERSGGSPSQPVGRVVIAPAGTEPCVPTDFQRLLRPNPDLVDTNYLFWRLWFDWKSGCTVHYSRKTTGITNLDVGSYLDRPMALPQLQEQRFLAETWGAMSIHIDTMTDEVNALSNVRNCLLQSMLDGEVTMPEDLDPLIYGVA